ncbi:intraflagellar transport protein 140 homolog [Cylas formicarius]|uniref:intraflagellar transport protein 140 homolog n=1 Tax=Cylas formicarius TaxID=197179 RepID=UPI0029583A86|nr:intraflagellar transport protein 140 homolog [Cylas formicarius]
MSLYIENPVRFPESGSISVNTVWHGTASLLAAASFSPDRGGFVIIFDELGESLKDVNYPAHRSYQVTALVWHPEKTILVSGWENGNVKVWNGNDRDFIDVAGPHKSPITLLGFSEKGGRLVSCDSTGSVVGWKVDSKGQTSSVFHLDLKEAVTHLVFRPTARSDFDVEGLARAAVDGDEHALDVFSDWRPKTTARKFKSRDASDNWSFFIGSQSGSIFYINAGGSCAEVLSTDGLGLLHMIFHPAKDSVIVVMEGLTIGHFSVDRLGHLTEIARVKLSGRMQARSTGGHGVAWAGNSSLAVLTGDLTVRVWDLDTNDNYVLPTASGSGDDRAVSVSEMFTCIAYCKLSQTVCAGTNVGRIYFWTKNRTVECENAEDAWELTNVCSISGTIKQLTWGSVMARMPLLGVNCVTTVYVVREQNVCSAFGARMWAVQKTATQLLLETTKGGQLLDVDVQVSDVALSDSLLVVSDGRRALIYAVVWKSEENVLRDYDFGQNKCDFSVKFSTSFRCDNDGVSVHDKTVIALGTQKVTLYTEAGHVVASIPSSHAEGDTIGMDVTAGYLTIFTAEGFLKVYHLGDGQPKAVAPARNVGDLVDDFGEVIQAKTNAAGAKVAITLAAADLVPDGRLYVWDIEDNQLTRYDFRRGVIETAGGVFDEVCANRLPLSMHWSEDDARLLVCDARRLRTAGGSQKRFAPLIRSQESKTLLKDEDHVVVTMFVSADNAIKIHDVRALDPDAKLLGVAIPYIATLRKGGVVRDVVNDFVGLESCDHATKRAVLDFSFHLSLGNMDAAFKSIKLVQSHGVWRSLAKMCVKTRRLDVAAVCLGHMGDARAARALRLAVEDSTLPVEAKVAVLAIHLGLLEEAERLYAECNRYDLMIQLLRAQNKMEAALAVAENKDRINLRNTQHAWGRALESDGDLKGAAARYERAGTHRYDVPRMLADHPDQLCGYMAKTKDKDLLKWWGQYLESRGDMDAALKAYADAADVYSQVRVLCFLGEEGKAANLARLTSDQAAHYHLARRHEAAGNVADAMTSFAEATAYCNAVRLGIEHGLSDQLWALSSAVPNEEKLALARYFEDSGDLEKAAALYYRGGGLHDALDLAFDARQYDVVQEIAAGLDAASDPALVDKCVRYFVGDEQYDRAVDLLATAKKYREAIRLCSERNVRLSEDLAEKLTPDKDICDEELRLDVLRTLAETLTSQGDYRLATKKFTQAGDKISAMKALLKSGDTEKVVFFAGVSRQREIYVMAANYLQTLDWQNRPDVLRHIVAFYSKGKALDLLANFYVSCAQVEIDEFQNYEKALEALSEASRCLQKISGSKEPVQIQRASDIVRHRQTVVKKFVDARKSFERGDGAAAMAQCRQLLALDGDDLEVAVRRGDVYAAMIRHCVESGAVVEARQLTAELRQFLSADGTPLTYYLNRESVEALARVLGVPVGSLVPQKLTREAEPDDEEDAVVDETVNK